VNEDKEKFDTPVQYLPGVGPKTGKKLAKLGVETIGDLVYFFPRKYLDYSDISSIKDAIKQDSVIARRNDEAIYNRKIATPSQKGEWLAMTKSDDLLDRLTGNNLTIKAKIVGINNKKTRRRGFTVTEAVVEDDTGTLKVVWFNQPYLSKMLPPGKEIIFHGKVKFDHFQQDYTMESPDWADKPKIVPVYRETNGITTHYLGRLTSKVKDEISKIEDYLPMEIIEQNNLLPLDQAVRILHEPKNMEELDSARCRMAFNELFLISLRGQVAKEELKKDSAPATEINNSDIEEFVDKLPFELTGDQKKAVEEILTDMSGESRNQGIEELAKVPMNRLLNGDVGSGKTIVAAIAAYATVKAGHKVMFMAPTEILAKQHYDSFIKLFFKHDINVDLVTSSTKNNKSSINNNQLILNDQNSKMTKADKRTADILIGTHALLHLKEPVEDVALVIVDEQHRFGVDQRAKLREINNTKNQKIKIENQNYGTGRLSKNRETEKLTPNLVPHFLSMTATPIPRSLQLALFAELDVSIIKEKPKNRKAVKTRVVGEANRQKAYQFIRAHVKAGRQVFVVVPLIESNTEKLEPNNSSAKSSLEEDQNGVDLLEIDRKSVVGEYDKLKKVVFPDLKIGMLHGKLKSKDKDMVMGEFSSGNIDILVSTSVVEVGVDVPNASIIMIEDAERFGLAQLHQFRGRVGRGEYQSFCLLFSSSQSSKSLDRLKKMEETSDGFKLAELDLKNRGAGDIFGTDQSGFLDTKFADITDLNLISKASKASKSIVLKDPNLSNLPLLKEKLGEFNSSKHFE
jgi:ATP-dependent DNA helicase RecG